jgi:ferredoxin-NADP reductase
MQQYNVRVKSVDKVTHDVLSIIIEGFLNANIGGINQYFYIYGPPPMIEAIEKQLVHLKVDQIHIVKEEF